MTRMTGWRYGVFVGSFVGTIGICLYAIMIRPMMYSEDYKQQRERVKSQLPPNKVV